MSSIDPGKLKVVELRAELSARGLDAKGNKPVLVKRLKEALEKELQAEIPDTSIADTSTEDVNTSQESIADDKTEDVETVSPEKEEKLPPDVEETPAEVEAKDEKEEPVIEPELIQKDKTNESVDEDEPISQPNEPQVTAVSENGDNIDQEGQESAESEKVEAMDTTPADESEVKTVSEEPKGEKRRRSSPSPERVQRRRSKSPIKEDEPALDNNKVQLSWYDSDLHLQLDKKSFLSGKPYHEGAFGYAWAGVRATHGVKLGKVCFEVKILEELKWEDLVKQSEKRRDSSKRDRQKAEKDNAKDSESSRENLKASDDSNADSEKEKSEETKDEKTTENNVTEESGTETKKEENDPDDNVESKEAVEVEDTKAKAETVDSKEEPAEAKQEKPMEVDETPVEVIAKHIFRVGWSTVDSVLQLGEAEHSYGYESTGKFVQNKEFVDYGVKFGAGDVVGAYVDIGDDCIVLNYTVNGELQPQASNIPRADVPQENFALFPHILTRNCSFELNLGSREEPWFPHPSELADYVYLEAAEDKVQGPSRPETRSECEVIMMCGLPASGKTHWVRQLIKENPEKRYTVIGNSHLLEKMTVNGNPLKNSYKGRWNVILDRLMKCLNVLVETAALRRRNFVIDQTNVFPSAQRRKMRLFEGFKRRAVVVVVADEEQTKRRAQQETQDGKDVPDSAILEMKANMSLPRRGDWLEEVSYVELGEEEAKTLIQKYNQQGREAGFGPISGQRSGYRDNRGHPYRWDHSTSRRDYRGGYRDNRSYQNSRYDRPRQHGGWQNRRPPPGSWNRDIRRDSRGPSSGSRDYRNNNRSSGSGNRQDRPANRDNRVRTQSSGNFNRNQRSQSNRNQPSNWQGGGSWQGQQGNWSGQGVWNQGNWGQGSWGGQAQQWKSGYGQGGYGQGGYGNYANWSYYGQYPQNWNSQNNVG